MSASVRHTIAGFAWVIGSLIAWVLVWHVATLVIFDYLGNERHVKLPQGIDTAFNWIASIGFVLVPTIVSVLVLSARLPGTYTRPSRTRGFSIELTQPVDPE